MHEVNLPFSASPQPFIYIITGCELVDNVQTPAPSLSRFALAYRSNERAGTLSSAS